MARRNSTLGRSVLDLDVDDSAFHSKLSGAYKAASRFTDQAGGSLMKAGKAISGVGQTVIRNVTVPILAAGGAVAHFALDFDTTMRRLVGLAKVPKEEIAGIREEIMGLAGETGRAPQELGEALYFVASAGFEAEEAMLVLRTAAKAAAAGMGETQDIAKVLGGVINAYGHENITAAHAGDVLTAAIQDGAAEAADFAGSIGMVVPNAAALGVSFDQVAAAMAAMTQVGISAETAAVNLGQILSSLQKPSVQAEEAMKGLGTSSAELRQELREKGLLATLRTLEERFRGNETASALVFGNIRALRGVSALLGMDTEQLNKIFGDTATALGNLQGAYQDTEGPQRELDRAMAKLQATAIELGADILPLIVDILEDVADAAAGLAAWWKTLDKGTKNLIVTSLAWLAIAGPTLLIVGKLTTGLGALLKVIGTLVGAKGIPALATAAARAKLVMLGWAGAAIALGIAIDVGTNALGDFIDEAIRGKKAAKQLKDLTEIIGNAKFAREVREWGISVKEFAELVDAAGGDAEAAFEALADAGGDLGKALTQLGFEAEDSAQAMFGGWGPRGPAGLAAIEAAKSAKAIPENVAAALIDGKFQVEEAAEITADPIAEALQKAREESAQSTRDLLKDLSTILAGGPDEIKDEVQAIIDAMVNPFTVAERTMSLSGALVKKAFVTAYTKDDPKLSADTFTTVMDLLAQFDLLKPGVFDIGEEVPPQFQAGVKASLGAALNYFKTEVRPDLIDPFDIARELDLLGYHVLATYARGMASASILEVSPAADEMQRDLHYRLDKSYFGEGYRVGITYGQGIAASDSYVDDKARQLAAGVQRFLEFAGSPAYTHSREIGEMVGETWGDGIVHAVGAVARAVQTEVAQVGNALALAPRIAVPDMPGLGGVDAVGAPAVWSGAGAPAVPASGDTYNLNVTGRVSVDDANDAITELRRLAGIKV